MDQIRREGTVLMAAAFVLALALIFMSDGWYVDKSFFWSLSNTMTLYDGYPFGCDEMAKEPTWLNKTEQDCRNSFRLVIPTRYLILLLMAIFIYGLMTMLRITPAVSELVGRYSGISKK